MSNSTYEDDDRLLDGDEKAFTNEDIDDDELLYSSDEENDWQNDQPQKVSNEVVVKKLDNDLQGVNNDLQQIKSYGDEPSYKEEREEGTFTTLESENFPVQKAVEVQTLVSTENKNALSGSQHEESVPAKESEDEGESDDDGSARRGDRFHSERKKDACSAINFRPEPASKRAIPDTLEISKEDQQRIENFSKNERDKKSMNNNKRKRGMQGGGRGKGNFQPHNQSMRQQFNRQHQMFSNSKMISNIRMQQRPPIMFQPQQRPPWKNHNSGVGGSILGQPPTFMQQPPVSINQPRIPPRQQLNFQQISTIRPLEPTVLLTTPPFRFSPPPNQQRQQSPVLRQQHNSFASTIPVLSRTASFTQQPQPNLTTIKTISTPQPAGNPIPTLLTSALPLQQQQKTTSPQLLQPHNFASANPYLSLSAQQQQRAHIAPPASVAVAATTNQQHLVKSDTAAQLMAAAAAATTRQKKSVMESLMEVTVTRKSRSPSPHRNRSSSSKRVVMRSSRRLSRSPSSRKRAKYSSSSRRRSKSRTPPDEAKPKAAATKAKILINPHFKGKVNLQNLTKQSAAQPSSSTTTTASFTTTATSQNAATNLLQAPITIPPPNLLTGTINMPPPNMTFPPNLINRPPPPLPSALLQSPPAAYQPLAKPPQVVVAQQQASTNNRQLMQQAPHNPIMSTSVNVAANLRNNVKSSSPPQPSSVKSRLGSKASSSNSSGASGTRLRPPPASAASNSKDEIKATVWGVVSDEDSIYRKKVEEQQLKRKLFLAEKAKKRMGGGREQGDEVKTVKFSNLASKTKAEVLKSLMNSVGGVESLQLFPQENSALGTFTDSKSVKAFTEKYNRYLLDLSYISVKPYHR